MTGTITEIAAKARRVPCPKCGAEPLERCWPPPGTCVERFAHAWKQGLIPAADYTWVLASVLRALAPDAVDEAAAKARAA